jgi:hypothetical protein
MEAKCSGIVWCSNGGYDNGQLAWFHDGKGVRMPTSSGPWLILLVKLLNHLAVFTMPVCRSSPRVLLRALPRIALLDNLGKTYRGLNMIIGGYADDDE